VENDDVFLSDRESILVYSLKDGHLRRRIGQRGQGPGEFIIGPLSLTVVDDRLIAGDFRRIIIFSLQGDYLGQVREPALLGPYNFLPVGSNFVGFAMERQEDGSFSAPMGYIYNQEGKVLQKFYRDMPVGAPPPPPPGGGAPTKKQDVPLIKDYTDYTVYKNRIYVADSRKGLFISVFDERGKFLYAIKPQVEKIRVPKGLKDSFLQEAKARNPQYWDFFNPVFPEFFPPFIGFKIDDDKIYVITPAQKDEKYEVIVMSLKGQILERSFCFPLKPQYDFLAVFNRTYDVEKDKFIWYAYNQGKEYYELFIY